MSDTIQNNQAAISGPAVSDRRTFLSRAALAAAGVAAVGMLTPSRALAVTPALTFNDIPGSGDIKVLNYALALEALETELYRQGVARLTTGGTDNFGHKIHGLGTSDKLRHVRFSKEFAKVEKEHRDFLIAALGSQSLLKKAPFNHARFDFGINSLDQEGVINLIYTAEKTGVGAYLGAIPFLQTKTYLQIAGSIQGTEARHTAVFADVLNDYYPDRPHTPVAPLASLNHGIDQPLAPNTVLAAVSPFIVI